MKNTAKKFTINEICTLVEMNKRTVRYYIQKGLVDGPEGIGKGAFYSHTHLEQLLTIRKWKAFGLSLERIQNILTDEKDSHDSGKPVPPPLTRKQGTLEVWSHMLVDDGVELQIEPGRAGLRPDQVRILFREIMSFYNKLKEEEAKNE